jgi:integrase
LHRSFRRDARKSGKRVVVGLLAQLRAILEPLAKEDPAALVFRDPRTGRMRPEHDAKHECWGIRELAEMAAVRRLKMPWHRFRNAHATAVEMQGATPSDIMRALGQKSIQVAMRYTDASPRRAAERVAMLPAIGQVRPDNLIDFVPRRRAG